MAGLSKLTITQWAQQWRKGKILILCIILILLMIQIYLTFLKITKKISFIAHQLWFSTKIFLKFDHFSSDQILDHIRKKCKKSKTLLLTKPKELILAMLMLKFSFKIIKTAAKVTFSENIYSFFLVKSSEIGIKISQKL